jgi:hypothetical protein
MLFRNKIWLIPEVWQLFYFALNQTSSATVVGETKKQDITLY